MIGELNIELDAIKIEKEYAIRKLNIKYSNASIDARKIFFNRVTKCIFRCIKGLNHHRELLKKINKCANSRQDNLSIAFTLQ